MGACSSHRRVSRPVRVHPLEMTSPPETIEGLRISVPPYIESNAKHKPKAKPELTNINKIMDEHFSPCTVKQPSVKYQYHQNGGSWSTQRNREYSVTGTINDDNSTSPPEDSQDECPPRGRQQSQNVGFDVTNLPPEVLEQLNNLRNSDHPEAKEAAEQLLNWIKNLPTPDNTKQSQEVADMMSTGSSDLVLPMEDNHVNITTELLVVDSDDSNWTNEGLDTLDAVKSDQIVPQCACLKLSRKDKSKSEPILSPIMSGEMIAIKEDEKGNFDLVEFSKRQVKNCRRKSLMMSQVLDEMPTLSQSLAINRRASSFSGRLPSLTKNGSIMLAEEDPGFENMTSKIDDLDKKISESTQKITELRRKSFGLLTDGNTSGESDEEGIEGQNLSFLNVEKAIDRWQTHKNKLVEERDRIVTEMQGKIIDQLTSTDLITPPDAFDKADDIYAGEKDKVPEQPQLPDRTLSLSVTESVSVSSTSSDLYTRKIRRRRRASN